MAVTQESQSVATTAAETIITSSTMIESQSEMFESLLVRTVTFESTRTTLLSVEGVDDDFFEGVDDDMICTPPHVEEHVVDPEGHAEVAGEGQVEGEVDPEAQEAPGASYGGACGGDGASWYRVFQRPDDSVCVVRLGVSCCYSALDASGWCRY